MKRSTLLMLAGASGFALSFAAVRLLAPPPVAKSSNQPNAAGNLEVALQRPLLAALPASDTLKNYRESGWLTLQSDLRGIAPAQRDAFLEEGNAMSEPPRAALLSLLLVQWAETDPAAASTWCMDHRMMEQCFADIANTWARRDGMALAHWFNDLGGGDRQKNPAEHWSDIVMNALFDNDPASAAAFMAMSFNKDSAWSDIEFEQRLRSLDDVHRMAAAVDSQVEYSAEGDALRTLLDSSSSGRSPQGKCGWNLLFEDTAVAFHKLDPAACDAWLAKFPENAREAAQHFIAKAEAPPPSTAPKPAPALAFERTNPAAVPATTAFADAYRQWSDWWRAEPQAAEAFLSASAWPEDLKFRARAKAYSSAP